MNPGNDYEKDLRTAISCHFNVLLEIYIHRPSKHHGSSQVKINVLSNQNQRNQENVGVQSS